MADNDHELMGNIFYYIKEKYWHHCTNFIKEGQKKYSNDSTLIFFNAYTMIEGGRLQEGMREMDNIIDKTDFTVAACMVLSYAHKKCKIIDNEAVQEYENKMRNERKKAGEKSLYFGGLIMFFHERYEKAKEYIDRMLKLNDKSVYGLVMKGWIELLCNRDSINKKAVKYFDEANELVGGKFVNALMGKVKFFEMCRHFSGALEVTNQIIVGFINFIPALIEKMKLQLALQDWDQTVDTAQRCLESDSGCIEALKYILLNILCREGNYQEAPAKLGDLLQEMDRHEPSNAHQFNLIASLFSKVAGRNKLVLQQCYHFQERAVALDKNNASFVTNLGNQLLLQERTKDATKCFRSALNIDEASVEALQGIINCQIIDNELQEATSQLDFLREIQKSGATASDRMNYLQAVLARKKGESQETILNFLDGAIHQHFAGLKSLHMSPAYYYHLNPDFLVQVIHEFMHHAPQSPQSDSQTVNPILKRCSQILDPLTRAMPGLQDGLYLMAKVKFLAGDMDSAQSILQHCLENDQSFSDAHILLAQVHLHNNNYKLADQSLEVGLSYNFEVRDHPVYHLIRSRILKKQGLIQEACKSLQTAMQLPGVRPSRKNSASVANSNKISMSGADRLSVYLELSEAHRVLGEQPEAAKVLQDAQHDFAGTAEEVRVTIANSELALQRADVEMALGILRTVTPDQTYFVEARRKMAEIYLDYRKDKKLFTACYRELVEKHPSAQTYLLLGDAYMRIQDPERAIEVYEQALKQNPRDLLMASKMGHALVKCHHYKKAIAYYEHAVKGGQNLLRYDLAELLLKMKMFEKAEKVLSQGLKKTDTTELEELIEEARCSTLLSQVHMKQSRSEEAVQDLHRAKECQARVLKRVQLEQADVAFAQKQFAAQICIDLAKHAKTKRDYDQATKYYKEALALDERNAKAALDLCKLYLFTEDLDACQQQCMILLKRDVDNDAATIMMADIMFRKQEYDQALYHFKQLLERQPGQYVALSRLIDVMRRAGRLEEVPRFLEAAEKSSTRALHDAGLQYCRGLYEWYTGNAGVALKYFNRGRVDSDWVLRSTYNMIEICLNPDNVTIGGEVFESLDTESESLPGGIPTNQSSASANETDNLGLKTAEKLLKELKPREGDSRHQYLMAMLQLASKSKGSVERGLQSLTEISQENPDQVASLYGMAAAYMILKQTPKARNTLKRLSSATWNLKDAEELEKSWLLLSDICIQSAKYDMAQELLKKVLQYNKSSCKAYEYMGYIMEKEQSHKEAAKNYELAWKYGKQNNPVIGYKLAFNYLKSLRYVDAIDICNHVLLAHPNYPKIKKDILDKARVSIRT